MSRLKKVFENLGYYLYTAFQWGLFIWLCSLIGGLAIRLTAFAWGLS